MKPKLRPRGPLLGAHMSIAGGVGNAFLEGQKVACEAIQIFTKSSRQWASKPLAKDEIAQFHANRQETGIAAVVAHDSYLLNLGSPDPALRKRSISAFIDEMERCEVLDVSNLIAHPGAHVGAGEVEGIKTIAKSLDEVHKACPGFKVRVTLEITAGQGSNLGYRFEQIGDIIDATKECDRLRVCFDTEHAFAAGYDIRTQGRLPAHLRRIRQNHRPRSARRVSFERLKKRISLPRRPPRTYRPRLHRCRGISPPDERPALLGPAHVFGNTQGTGLERRPRKPDAAAKFDRRVVLTLAHSDAREPVLSEVEGAG